MIIVQYLLDAQAKVSDPGRRGTADRPRGPDADLAWADAVLAAIGRPRVAPAQQVRTWNLSSLWRLETAGGAAWLKVVPPFFAHEGALLDALAGGPVAVPRGARARRPAVAARRGARRRPLRRPARRAARDGRRPRPPPGGLVDADRRAARPGAAGLARPGPLEAIATLVEREGDA